jgi:site-specific DNA recombinase
MAGRPLLSRGDIPMALKVPAHKGKSPTKGGREWAAYLRLSKAIGGRELEGVERQERICRALAEKHGIDLRRVYTDNNLSAWKPDRKRPAWDRMLADIERGEIAGLLTVHGDRLMRHPDDCGALIKASDAGGGIAVLAPDDEYSADLRNPDVKAGLWEGSIRAWREVARTSRRVRDAVLDKRRQGIVSSRARMFGYAFTTTGTGHDRNVLSWTVDPVQAAIIREVARRLIAGEPHIAICRDLTTRGIRTADGYCFDITTMKNMIRLPRHGGEHVYQEADGKPRRFELLRPVDMPDGEPWPILDRATYDALHRYLATKGSGPCRRNHYLLSGVLTCGKCGGSVRGHGRYKARNQNVDRYACQRCFLSIIAEPVDDLVSKEVLKWYATVGSRLDVDNAPATDGELAAARADIARIGEAVTGLTAKLLQTKDQTGRPLYTWETISDDPAMRTMDRMLADARRRVAELDIPERTIIRAGANAQALWDSGDIDTRRNMVRTAVRVLTISPASKRGGIPCFDPDRITLKLK